MYEQFLMAARAMAARERLAKELGAVLDDEVEGRSGIAATKGGGRTCGPEFGAIRQPTAAATLRRSSGDTIAHSVSLRSNPAIAKDPRSGGLKHICPSPGDLG